MRVKKIYIKIKKRGPFLKKIKKTNFFNLNVSKATAKATDYLDFTIFIPYSFQQNIQFIFFAVMSMFF